MTCVTFSCARWVSKQQQGYSALPVFPSHPILSDFEAVLRVAAWRHGSGVDIKESSFFSWRLGTSTRQVARWRSLVFSDPVHGIFWGPMGADGGVYTCINPCFFPARGTRIFNLISPPLQPTARLIRLHISEALICIPQGESGHHGRRSSI